MDIHPAPQSMNARLVVMMTPADKAAIEGRARTLDLSTSEFVRRAAHEYESADPAEQAALELLADALEKTVASMRTSFERSRRDFEFHSAEIGADQGVGMTLLDRVLGSVRELVVMRSELDRMASDLSATRADVRSHEARLICIETMIEMGGRSSPQALLPK